MKCIEAAVSSSTSTTKVKQFWNKLEREYGRDGGRWICDVSDFDELELGSELWPHRVGYIDARYMRMDMGGQGVRRNCTPAYYAQQEVEINADNQPARWEVVVYMIYNSVVVGFAAVCCKIYGRVIILVQLDGEWRFWGV
jgi:hypothetical protein